MPHLPVATARRRDVPAVDTRSVQAATATDQTDGCRDPSVVGDHRVRDYNRPYHSVLHRVATHDTPETGGYESTNNTAGL